MAKADAEGGSHKASQRRDLVRRSGNRRRASVAVGESQKPSRRRRLMRWGVPRAASQRSAAPPGRFSVAWSRECGGAAVGVGRPAKRLLCGGTRRERPVRVRIGRKLRPGGPGSPGYLPGPASGSWPLPGRRRKRSAASGSPTGCGSPLFPRQTFPDLYPASR